MSGWLFGRHRQLAKTLLLRLSLTPLNEPKTISYIWVLGVTIQHYESDVLCDPARTSQTLPILVGCIKDVFFVAERLLHCGLQPHLPVL
jgi:hypothetical protein